MKLLRISDFFKTMAGVIEDRPQLQPPNMALEILKKLPQNYQSQEMVNIGAGFVCWWRARPAQRFVWRIMEPTATYLATVGLGFIPEHPPGSWSGNAILAEAAGEHCLFRNVFSVMAYRTAAVTRDEDRYFFVMLKRPDGIRIFSIKAEAGNLAEDRLLDAPMLRTDIFDLKGEWNEEALEESLACIRFVFAMSYYADKPERVEIRDGGGPIERNPKGKPVKRKGKTVSVWRYRDMTVRHVERKEEGAEGRELDKERLTLAPVIVSPYIRRHKEKVIIVDAHDSHRWKRKEEVIGEKRRV